MGVSGPLYIKAVGVKGFPSLPIMHFFFMPPPLPTSFGGSILTDWEALCTALRLDKITHRSDETMSNIPQNLSISTLKESFCVNFK